MKAPESQRFLGAFEIKNYMSINKKILLIPAVTLKDKTLCITGLIWNQKIRPQGNIQI